MMPGATNAEPRYAGGVIAVARNPDARIATIDRQRAERGLTHIKFCRLAGLDERQWQRMRCGDWTPRDRTIARLRGVLVNSAADATPLNVIKAFHRAALSLLVTYSGADLAVVLSQDLSVQRPQNVVWLQAARLHMMAMYLTTVELEVSNAVLARAIDGSRQNVKQARDKVEDLRGDDPNIEALLTRVAALLTGEA